MVSLYLNILFLSSAFACGCEQQWHLEPDPEHLNIYINKTMPGQYEMLTWQWITSLNDGIWTVTLKRWPKIEYATGTVKFKNSITNMISHMSWKIKKNTLTWTKHKGVIFQPPWNMSVCNLNVDWGFKVAPLGQWDFRLGNVTMSTDVGSSPIEQIEKRDCSKKRYKRAPEDDVEEIPTDDGSGTERPSVIKWLLKKTGLEQGDNDQRTWWERVADLVVAWLKALFA